MSDDASTFDFLVSGWALLLTLVLFYIGRALWIARRELLQCEPETKILYLLVAPVLTFAVDVLEFTDRLFWTGRARLAYADARRSNVVRLRR